MRAFSLVVAALLAAASFAAPAEDDSLTQIFPNSIETHLASGKVVLTAFVNPVLPHSAKFQPTLLELKAMYSKGGPMAAFGDRFLVSFADVGSHRIFTGRYGLRTLPTLFLFFPLLSSRHPVPLEYSPNTTAADYARAINHYITAVSPSHPFLHGDGPASSSASLNITTAAAASAAVVANNGKSSLFSAVIAALKQTHADEWRRAAEERRKLEETQKKTNEAGATAEDSSAASKGKATDDATATVKADGEVAGSDPAEKKAEGEREAPPSHFSLLLSRIEAEEKYQQKLFDIKLERLKAMAAAVRTMEAQGTAGITKRRNEAIIDAMAIPTRFLNASEGAVMAAPLVELSLLSELVEQGLR